MDGNSWTGKTICEVARQKPELSEEEFDWLLDACKLREGTSRCLTLRQQPEQERREIPSTRRQLSRCC